MEKLQYLFAPQINRPNKLIISYYLALYTLFTITDTIIFVNVIVVLQHSLSPTFLAAGLEGGKKVTALRAPKVIYCY